MLRALVKILRFTFYALLIIIGITFAVSNRAKITLTLFPLPYELSLPTFLFAILIFVLGIILGWSLSHVKFFKHSLIHRKTNARVAAVENELAALRSEQLLKQNPPSLK